MAKIKFLRRRPSPVAVMSSDVDGLDRRSLIYHREFRHLWAAETVSQFGTQMSVVALPLMAALLLDATAFEMGLLAAAGTAPFLLFGLVVGVWVDRLPRRPLLIAADIARFALLLVIPISWTLDMLSIELLYSVAFLVGVGTVVFNLAYVSCLPSVVRRDQLIEGNGKLEMSASTAQVAGPAAGGALIGWFTGPVAILIDAISYLFSAWFILRMRVTESSLHSVESRERIHHEISTGIAIVLRNATLRAIAASGATVSFFGHMFLAVYILFLTGSLGLGATAVGLVFALGGVGALLGAVIAGRLAERFGMGPTIIVSYLLFGVGGMAIPVALSIPDIALPLVLFAEFFQWMVLVAGTVNVLSLRQTITPDRMLGRVSATTRFLSAGAIPIGSLLGGFLGGVIGIRETLVVGCFGMLLSAAWFIGSPVWSIRGEVDVVPLDVPALAPAFD